MFLEKSVRTNSDAAKGSGLRLIYFRRAGETAERRVGKL